MSLYPQTAERVLDHVAHNPVRRKQLRCCRNTFFRDLHVLFQTGKRVILQLGVVILVQPADNLHGILPVLLRNIRNHASEHAVRLEDVIRQQHFRVAAHALKHPRQRFVQRVALRQQQVAIQALGVVAFNVFCNLTGVQSRQFKVQNIRQNFRLKRTIRVRKHTDMRRQVIVYLHKTKCDKAVEPSVGNFLHHLLVALGINLLDEFSALGFLLGSQQSAANRVSRGVAVALCVNAVLIRTLRDLLDQLRACPDGKLLYCGFVHLLHLLVDLHAVAIFQCAIQLIADTLDILIDVLLAVQALD